MILDQQKKVPPVPNGKSATAPVMVEMPATSVEERYPKFINAREGMINWAVITARGWHSMKYCLVQRDAYNLAKL